MLGGKTNKNIYRNHEIDKIDLGHGDYGDIRSKISSSHFENALPICTSSYSKNTGTFIIKLNLERATINDVSLFNDFLKVENVVTYSRIILDLYETTFLDSTFLGSIVRLLKQLSAKGNKLSLVVDFNKVKILTPFEQLKNLLNIYPTVDSAISAYIK